MNDSANQSSRESRAEADSPNGGGTRLTRLLPAPLRRLLARGYSRVQTRQVVEAPDEALVVGVEVYVPHRPGAARTAWRLTAYDRLVGRLPQFGPYIDVGFRSETGWRTFEFPLFAPPPAGSEVAIEVGIDPQSGPAALLWSQLDGYRVRRAWLRGARLSASDVTIVVLNWKRPADTIRCLESLAEADLRGASVLVVDNGSGDRSVETIRARFPDQEILSLPENRGYSGGNNAGILAALHKGAKAVLVLNNDTVVAPDFLHPLVWVLNTDAKAAAVSSGVLRSDHPDILESAYLEIYFGHGIIRHYGVNALPGQGFNSRREVEVVVGCSVLLSADALNEVGPLDESYFAYHEEVEWCFRARRAGYRIYWHPYSRVWHTKSTSTAALARPVRGVRTIESGPQLPAAMPLTWNPVQTYLGARNAVRFIRRHATLRQKLYFTLSSLYGVPLELLAAVMRQEPALKIGAFNYRRALWLYCATPRGAHGPEPSPSLLAMVARVPYVLLRALPRDVGIARREGRLGQVGALVRGLWDGLLDRPLPLERLGLR